MIKTPIPKMAISESNSPGMLLGLVEEPGTIYPGRPPDQHFYTSNNLISIHNYIASCHFMLHVFVFSIVAGVIPKP